MKLSKGYLASAIILSVVVLDQILKIWVKTSFYLGEDLRIADFFHLYFIENNGMAFGMEIGNKLFLTIFRVIVASFVICYIYRIKSKNYIKKGYIVCFSLIAAGAIGNIIDCLFYGLIFNNPFPPEVATLFPESGGYAPLFYGKVVDMFYFPLFSFDWPEWIPWLGGEHFIFFQPVFNLADAAISVGMVALILFYSKYLSNPQPVSETEDISK